MKIHRHLLALALVTAAPSASPAPGPRDLLREPPPVERSPSPKPDEWKRARAAVLARPLPEGCQALSLREWLRIQCRGRRPASLALLSGRREGVALWISNRERDEDSYAEILMPLRKGDRRLIQLSEFAAGESFRGRGDQSLGFVLSEQWLEGMPGPWVTIH